MSRNRVWIAVLVGFVLSFATLLNAQDVTTSTKPDAMVDVLKTLESKGVISPAEFTALKKKVTDDQQQAAAAPQLKTVAMQAEAAPSNAITASDSGVGFHAGRFDVSFSGEVNGFYVHDRADNTPTHVSCLLCEASAANAPSSSVRSGLLPGDLSIKIATQEKGWDVAVFFGIWPAIQNSSTVGIVEGGVNGPAALGTPGIDFRQQFATLGRANFGTLKIGRDLGLFGQEAILNDFTLLGAGSPGLAAAGNTNPGNVTLGRIGVGYVYTDFLPQITYTTPARHGVQGAFAVIAPYEDPLSPVANLNANGQPMFQGKLTYSTGKYKVKAKFWSNFVTQAEQANVGGAGNLAQGQSVRATGVDYGTKLDYHGVSVVAYGYNGWGLGTTGLLWDGMGVNAAGTGATTRNSSGYYGQATYTYHKATVGYSYGQSIVTAANATDLAFLTDNYVSGIRANSSHIGQFRYAVTSWDNLVAEYTHTRSEAYSSAPTNITTSDSIALGTIVFF